MLMGIGKVKRNISKSCCGRSELDVITEVFQALCVLLSFNWSRIILSSLQVRSLDKPFSFKIQ